LIKKGNAAGNIFPSGARLQLRLIHLFLLRNARRKEGIRMNMDTRLWLCAVGSGIVSLLGGWDMWLTALLILLAIDMISEIIRSLLVRTGRKKAKSSRSKLLLRGAIKKIYILCLVAMGALLDQIVFEGDTLVRNTVAGYYIATEGLHILEHISACGVPLPKLLYSVLHALRKDHDDDHSSPPRAL